MRYLLVALALGCSVLVAGCKSSDPGPTREAAPRAAVSTGTLGDCCKVPGKAAALNLAVE